MSNIESPFAWKSRRAPYPCTMPSLTCRMKFTTYEKAYGYHTYHCSSTYGWKCTWNLFQNCSMWKHTFCDHNIVPILPHIAPTQSHHKRKTIGVHCKTKGVHITPLPLYSRVNEQVPYVRTHITLSHSLWDRNVRVIHVDFFERSTFQWSFGGGGGRLLPSLRGWVGRSWLLGYSLAAIYDSLLLKVQTIWEGPIHWIMGVKWRARVMTWYEDKTHNTIVQKGQMPTWNLWAHMVSIWGARPLSFCTIIWINGIKP